MDSLFFNFTSGEILPVTETEHSLAPRWPDFYALLETTPEADSKTLRRQLNLLYDRANQNSDHRELKKRFYFQLLNQKVLPQCRRILLDDDARHAYDTQWQLHFLGASDALSYPKFIARLRQTHERVVSGLSEVDEEELELLPSIVPSENMMAAEIPTQITPEQREIRAAVTPIVIQSSGAATTPKVAPTGAVQQAEARASSDAASGATASGAVALSARQKNRSNWPYAAIGVVALLGLGGWMASRGAGSKTGEAASFQAEVSASNWKPVSGYIMTDWGKKVAPDKVLPEYPRPQLARKQWQNLNGLWNYALTERAAKTAPAENEGQILVPYPYESALSGVGKGSIPDKKLWYRHNFTVPAGWKGQRIILHFGAVNWEATVKVNGQRVGSHKGGYDGFDFDITGALQAGGNTLEVAVSNPVDANGGQVVGKQRAKSEAIWYTASTGIWQTVWLEPVPTTSIKNLAIVPDIDDGTLSVKTQLSGAPGEAGKGATIEVEAFDGQRSLGKKSGAEGKPIELSLSKPKLWTPETPKLYNLRVSLLQNGKTLDSVDSYFAMRKASVGRDAKGVMRLMLNNRFVMQRGVLDQGYWPDGLYTAPSDEALQYDIVMAKKLGFNMCRKHAKVEPARWYYHADKLGLLVWQDMPQGFVTDPSPEVATQFKAEWQRIIEQNRNSPSIIVWTTFNEGWGQHATGGIVDFTRHIDPSRPVDEASGWNDAGTGDIADFHNYPSPKTRKPDGKRATVNGEFGGIGLIEAGHTWNTDVKMNYGEARNGWDLTRQYQALMRTAHALRDNSQASAFVYTQLTDVEQETNGLLTYDRKIIKPILATTSAATRGQFLPMPANPNPELLPTALDVASKWAYSEQKPSDNWMKPNFDSKAWKTGAAGFGKNYQNDTNDRFQIRTNWDTPDIWMRREISLPASLPKTLTFLCAHDEDVEIYVNGVLAAQATGYTTNYVSLPITPEGRAAFKPGKNLVALHCHQTMGGQYVDLGIASGS